MFVLKPVINFPEDRPLIRVYSQSNFSKFYENLNHVSWDSVYNETDPNTAYSKFHEIFHAIFNESFPKIKASRKWTKNKTWITPAIQKSIRTKSKFYKQWITNKNPDTENTYKTYANMLKKVIKSAKKGYYNQLFNNRFNKRSCF